MRIPQYGALAALLAPLLLTPCLYAIEPVPLIPRKILFGNPDRTNVQISRDGRRLAWLAPKDGVLNVWVASATDPSEARAVTTEAVRGIREYYWSAGGDGIIFTRDTNGDENWHVCRVDVDTAERLDLTPWDGIQARIQEVSPEFPDEILVAINRRDPRAHDLYRIKLRTGHATLVEENKHGFLGYLTDRRFDVRFALRMTEAGGQELLRRNDAGGWSTYLSVPPQDSVTTRPLRFNRAGDTLYLFDSRDRNTAALVALDLNSGKPRVLAEDPRADAQNVLMSGDESRVLAVGFVYERTNWDVVDTNAAEHIRRLKEIVGGDFSVVSATEDDRTWIVLAQFDDASPRYFRYDTVEKEARLLFTAREALNGQPLRPMRPVVMRSRDGLGLVSYLTTPAADDGSAAPMVLLVHGGPWARDYWGYNALHQWLANRGYAVLSVNFRGSTGFGKNFTNAGDREWAGKMHEDLLDAVDWAVRERIADPDHIAIMGASYGGYAALVGLSFTPDVFACGVDIVGPSNLVTLLESIPPYWTPMVELFVARVGDHRTEEGRKALLARSPLERADRIRRPLLIGQGANDPRVKQSEADQIVRALRGRSVPVTYILYPDEGHGFARPENRMSFYAATEAFLSRCLGGRCEPVGTDFDGSTIRIEAGADYIPEAAAALPADRKSSAHNAGG